MVDRQRAAGDAQAEPRLQEASGRRQAELGRLGAEYEEVDGRGRNTRLVKETPAGGLGQIERRLARRRHTPRADTCLGEYLFRRPAVPIGR